MLTLFHHPGNASLTPHMLLEELGVPYQLRRVDRDRGEHKSEAYLRLNPNGLIPVLVDARDEGDGTELVIFETAAICLHLLDTHPQCGFVPAVGTPQRALFYQWLVWLTNTLQATLLHYFYGERIIDVGDRGAERQVKAHAERLAGGMLDLLDAELARHGKPWLLGSVFSAVDLYALMLCRWTRAFERPARDLSHLGPYLQRVLARPAVRRAFEQEGLALPWV